MAKREKVDFIEQFRLVAHRGLHDNSNGVPENSMTAFQLAIERGHAIELDVRITADNKLSPDGFLRSTPLLQPCRCRARWPHPCCSRGWR